MKKEVNELIKQRHELVRKLDEVNTQILLLGGK